MWKIIIISALLTIIQATNLKPMYGDWTMVAFYPASAFAPVCLKYSFSKSPVTVKCIYADGSNATPVQVEMTRETGELLERYMMPMRAVDNPAEVMPALNISCKCGAAEFKDHAVVRLVNDNYFIMFHYVPESMESTRTEVEKNAAYLFAKNIVSENELFDVMSSIEDLKDRRGAMMCTSENYSGFINEINKNELL